MQQVELAFAPVAIATKLLLSLGIGLLVGFEREWSHKDLGVRTFAIISLFGMLAALIAPLFVFIGLTGVIALLVVVNVGALWTQRPLEATTSAALLVTFALGVLIGQGHVFTPTASAIVRVLQCVASAGFSRVVLRKISATTESRTFGLRPGRGASFWMPAIRSFTKRCRQTPTVRRVQPSLLAIWSFRSPAAADSTSFTP